MKKICCIFFFIMAFVSFSQNRRKADSLLKLIPLKKDSTLVKLYCDVASAYSLIHADSARLFVNKALRLSDQLHYRYGTSAAFNAMGIVHHMRGDFDSACFYYQKCLQVRKQLNDIKGQLLVCNNIALSYFIAGRLPQAINNYATVVSLGRRIKDTLRMADAFNSMASVYINMADYEKALNCYLSAARLFEAIKDTDGITEVENNIGIVYEYMGNDSFAIMRFERSIEICKKSGNKNSAAFAYGNLGTIYQKKGKLDKAMELYNLSLEINKRNNDESGAAVNYINIGEVFLDRNEPGKAEQQFLNAFAIDKKLNNVRGIADCYLHLGRLENRKKAFHKSAGYLTEALSISVKAGFMEFIAEIYSEYAVLYRNKKDFKKSYDYRALYSRLKDSLLNEEKNTTLAAMQQRFESEKQEAEIATLKKDNELNTLRAADQQSKGQKQLLVLLAASAAILIVLSLVFFFLKGYIATKRAGEQLVRKNEDLLNQKNLLHEKNVVVTDSIEYARNIQETILPPASQLSAALGEHFVLYKPKDIVAGDFYWLHQQQDALFFAACDCTGHGVPGAFMSMHGYYLMEKIMKEQQCKQPAQLLNELNAQMTATLHQTSRQASAKYGIDMAVIKFTKNALEFSGARNPLLIVTDKIEEIKADRIYVGGAKENFTNHVLHPPKGSMLYLFTDGYADQKGGTEGKKFFATAFREVLLSLSHLPVQEQKERLDKVFEEWKGSNEQMDDVLIAGIRIN